MSNPRDDHYYHAAVSKSNKTPPLGDSQSSGFFQTGQGGRTVLPPLSSAFPTSLFPGPVSSYSNHQSYTQPRSSPSRCDYNPAVYNQWVSSPNNSASTQMPSSFAYYETHDSRYPSHSQEYYSSYTSRPSVTPSETPTPDSRKLPPLNTSASTPPSRDERWAANPYPQTGYGQVGGSSGSTDIRSTATYPHPYPTYPATGPGNNAYAYDMTVADSRGQQLPHTYPQAQNTSPQVSPPSYTPPISPTTGSDEPTIKKKRKRADAQQLKILNETYARTPFPSTEERLALARQLDMSARSVQIWFQNKRQQTKQTRQSSSAQSHQGYTLTSDMTSEESRHSMRSTPYDPSGNQSHVPRSSPEVHTSPTLTSSHRRVPRPQETVPVDPRKQWPRYS
ncbi:hypothetical protein Moror_6850 [Moniliophthora roreri MCA 2997]|uniref:Homeobox domain-containing protein n=1 Tax=Moniliophthora roreri (strain MCA 2997) TaxID=1381753 RepID=V2XVT1_MONRO|nr:hypothetical protein Moror_6850 [Moniliophthora roreri MCA 2997]